MEATDLRWLFALIFVLDTAKESTRRTWQLVRVVAAGLNLGAALVVLVALVVLAGGIGVGFLTDKPVVALVALGLLVGAVSPIVALGFLVPSLLARFARGYRWRLAEYSLELDPDAPAEQVFRLRLKVRCGWP